MLVTPFNCAHVLSFSNPMLVPLGWAWGMTCLVVVASLTHYANWLLAGFHVIDGQRFISHKDLMGYTFRGRMYYLTYFLQFTTLLLGNMGFILLGGRALKEINSEFSDSPLRLQYCIAVIGVVYFIFAYFVPTMSAMRNWLEISAILTGIYDVILVAIIVKDGTIFLHFSIYSNSRHVINLIACNRMKEEQTKAGITSSLEVE